MQIKYENRLPRRQFITIGENLRLVIKFRGRSNIRYILFRQKMGYSHLIVNIKFLENVANF